MVKTAEEFKKHIRYRRVKALFVEAIRMIVPLNSSDHDAFDLDRIVGYELPNFGMFPGQPVNVPKGWTCFIRENPGEVFEIPEKGARKGWPVGRFLILVHYTVKDEYMLARIDVSPANGWYAAKYYYYDGFNVTYDSSGRPTANRFRLNGSFCAVWPGRFDCGHCRAAAYEAVDPSAHSSYHEKLGNGNAYYNPTRRKRVKIYSKARKGRSR